jgi:hypothetical protein
MTKFEAFVADRRTEAMGSGMASVRDGITKYYAGNVDLADKAIKNAIDKHGKEAAMEKLGKLASVADWG